MAEEIEITELVDISPERVDGVGSPANGTDWLILKATDSASEREDCPLCKGTGKIKDGHVRCPKCLGSGKKPEVGDSAKATAPSGAPVPVTNPCPTCDGTGVITDSNGEHEKECPDCEGSGKDGTQPSTEKLAAVDAPTGSVQVGDARETIDKAQLSAAEQNDLPDSDFAYIEPGGKKDSSGKTVPRDLRHFCITDAAHVRNALARASQSPFGDKAMPKIEAAAKKFGIEVSDDDSKKSADEPVEKDGVTSGSNPFLGAAVTSLPTTGDDDSDTTPVPGSPDWEAEDAEIASNAAQALMQAAELISQFAEREAIEVAAGEGNDLFDTWDADQACQLVTSALGIIARLAFHEGVAAAEKSNSEDGEPVSKAGKRLSTKSVNALATARDHLNDLLGDDDPAKAKADDDDEGKSSKSLLSKDIEEMTVEELAALVREESKAAAKKAVEKAAKGKSASDNAEAIANAKAASKKSKKKAPKAENTDLEDEADQGDNASASGTNETAGAAKSEEVADESEAAADAAAEDDGAEKAAKSKKDKTPEEIQARKALKKARRLVKQAKRDKKEAAKQADVAKAIKEEADQARELVKTLEERLATVEKMAAPGGPVKTRTPQAVAKAAERDALDLEIARYERLARETSERDLQRGYIEKAKALRAQMSALTADKS